MLKYTSKQEQKKAYLYIYNNGFYMQHFLDLFCLIAVFSYNLLGFRFM